MIYLMELVQVKFLRKIKKSCKFLIRRKEMSKLFSLHSPKSWSNLMFLLDSLKNLEVRLALILWMKAKFNMSLKTMPWWKPKNLCKKLWPFKTNSLKKWRTRRRLRKRKLAWKSKWSWWKISRKPMKIYLNRVRKSYRRTVRKRNFSSKQMSSILKSKRSWNSLMRLKVKLLIKLKKTESGRWNSYHKSMKQSVVNRILYKLSRRKKKPVLTHPHGPRRLNCTM